MNRNSVIIISLISLLFILVIHAQDNRSAENQSKPEMQEQLVKVYDSPASTLEAFRDALRIEKKPGGIVVLDRQCMVAESKPHVSLDFASSEAALNSIVRQDPLYGWSLEDGVVNLIPTNREPRFLKTQIKKFRLEGELNIHLALEKLLELPEVKSKAAEINLNRGLMYGGLQSPRDTKFRLKFELRNVTLSEALNEIVRKEGTGVWKYYDWTCGGKTDAYIEIR